MKHGRKRKIKNRASSDIFGVVGVVSLLVLFWATCLANDASAAAVEELELGMVRAWCLASCDSYSFRVVGFVLQ